MDLKQKYREETNLEPYGDINQKDNYTRHYVEWLEKQCNLYDVSQQRELLLAFVDFIEQPHHNGAYTHTEFVEMFLANNGG